MHVNMPYMECLGCFCFEDDNPLVFTGFAGVGDVLLVSLQSQQSVEICDAGHPMGMRRASFPDSTTVYLQESLKWTRKCKSSWNRAIASASTLVGG